VKLAEFEQWRLALEEGGTASTATIRRIRNLERELARKEKALADEGLYLASESTMYRLQRRHGLRGHKRTGFTLISRTLSKRPIMAKEERHAKKKKILGGV